VRHKWDVYNYDFFSSIFDKKRFFKTFTTKLLESINLSPEAKSLSRREMEISYPLFRYRYFQSLGHSTNLFISDSLMPLMEPKLLFPSFDLPISLKYNGRFEGALINRVNNKLASYPSNYGHNFTSELPINKKLRGLVMRNLPLSFKPYLRYINSSKNSNLDMFNSENSEIDKIFDSKSSYISHFANVKMIKDPNMLSRAYTLEYFFRKVL
jgi:asparagine synthase (glutamine-hydrolysing)